MKKHLLLLLLFIPFFATSQEAWQPQDSATTWNGRELIAMAPGWVEQTYISFRVDSEDYDTLIGDQTYSKLIARTNTTDRYLLSFRSDIAENAIYFIPKDSTEEYLFFDFDESYEIGDMVYDLPLHLSLNEGDFVINDFVIVQIDSIMIDDEYKRYWVLESEEVYLNITEQLINHQGFPFMAGGFFETWYDFKCYMENDEPIYGSWCPFSYEEFTATSSLPDPAEGLTEFEVYPNPTENALSFVIDPKLKGNYQITIYNIQGQPIMFYTAEDNFYIEIDLSHFAGGTYLYSIQSQNLSQVGKVVKL